jgi:hypothetical protein
MANTCAICSAPPKVLDAVNAGLEQKTPLRTLAAASGFSRAGISRHARKCVPKTVISTHRSSNYANARLLVRWNDGPILDWDRQSAVPLAENQISDNDVILQVAYAKPAPPAAEPVPVPDPVAPDAPETPPDTPAIA